MIEEFLISGGLGCGTVKNFQSLILKNMKLAALNISGNDPKWYFKTPLKISGAGLKTTILDLAFPFIAIPTDIDESTVLQRIEDVRKCYENDLLTFLRQKFIVPPGEAKFSVIPFWATETGTRNERQDFAGIRVHILNAVVVVKYRDSWFD